MAPSSSLKVDHKDLRISAEETAQAGESADVFSYVFGCGSSFLLTPEFVFA